MATVKISSEFFENEIRNYSNWEQAFWRELFQNSIDAGSTEINISYEKIGSSCIVSFRDNGKGMDRNVLENVFFNLGTTTKNSSNTVGGFGRARIILCFAQTDYQIFTGDIFVQGAGADYEIEEGFTYYQGCKFLITVPLNKFYSDFEKFERALMEYLALCNFKAAININNIPYKNNLIARGKKKDLSFGTAFANKSSADKNKIIFRVNGVAMFTRYTSADIQVIVEIWPEKSRQVLLSNRDSLTWMCQDEVEKFCELISKETLSAFREKSEGTLSIGGTSRRFVSPSSKVEFSSISKEDLQNTITQLLSKGDSYISSKATIADHDTDGLVVLTKTEDKKIKAAARNFSPDKINSPESRKLKILKQWIIACEAALESYCKITKINEINWRPGFVFDESVEACHKFIDDDNSHSLMLNPVYTSGDNIGKLKFSITSFHSHVELLTLAAHEVAHCEYKWHDESYAGLFTDIVSDMMKNINILSKEMKTA